MFISYLNVYDFLIGEKQKDVRNSLALFYFWSYK